jgi:LacI family transcriptional regulator
VAIDKLGYQSNPLARSMITGKTRALGVAILDIRNPHFTSLVKGANRIALEHGYSVLFVDTEESQAHEDELLEALSRRVDGMLISSRMPDAHVAHIVAFGKPIVFLGRVAPAGIPSLGGDSRLGAAMVGELLVKQGHRRVAYLGFAPARPDRDRMGGLKESLARHGLPLSRFEARQPIAEEGRRMCSTIAMGKGRPDALVCYNDLLALGFMREARALGVRVPADISVTGFDNIVYGDYASPGLTTVDMQSERMGEEGTRLLLRRIAGEALGEDGHLKLQPQLIVRESTADRVPLSPGKRP